MSDSLKPLAWYKALADGNSRRETGCFLVEGERAIRQIAGLRSEAILELLTIEPLPASLNGYPVRFVTEKQLRSVSNATTPQGIVAVVSLPDETCSDTLPDSVGNRILVLEDIQDPGNVGTLIRTAAAFDYSGIILSARCADPFSPKCVQSAAGSVLSLWIRRSVNYFRMTAELKERAWTIVGTTLEGDYHPDVFRQDKLVLALGNEAAGLSADLLKLADFRFRLPVIPEKAESLNVAVCGGICMYLGRKESC